MTEEIHNREERRRKIRELEASLFGSSTSDTLKIDLPELKNVDEYSSRFGIAERQKRQESARSKLDDFIGRKFAHTVQSTKSKMGKKRDDTKKLISFDDDGSDEKEYFDFENTKSVVLGKPEPGLSSRTPRNRLHFDHIPRSESEALDGNGSFWTFDENPKQSVLQNLKKRHGFLKPKKSGSFDGFGENLGHSGATRRESLSFTRPDKDPKYTQFLTSLSGARSPPSLADSGSFSSDSDKDPLGLVISGSRLKHLKPIERPAIQIDESPKQPRANPIMKEKVNKNLGMVNFDHLELPTDSSVDIFRDIPSALNDMPTDVFDKIPRAVTAREEKRLMEYHKKLERSRELRKEEQKENLSVPEMQADPKKVSLIAALFTTSPQSKKDNNPRSLDLAESDFMFALFIQKQEDDAALKATNNGRKPSRPDPNDPDVGHFCAPFCPGFCEANFCIFHSGKNTSSLSNTDER